MGTTNFIGREEKKHTSPEVIAQLAIVERRHTRGLFFHRCIIHANKYEQHDQKLLSSRRICVFGTKNSKVIARSPRAMKKFHNNFEIRLVFRTFFLIVISSLNEVLCAQIRVSSHCELLGKSSHRSLMRGRSLIYSFRALNHGNRANHLLQFSPSYTHLRCAYYAFLTMIVNFRRVILLRRSRTYVREHGSIKFRKIGSRSRSVLLCGIWHHWWQCYLDVKEILLPGNESSTPTETESCCCSGSFLGYFMYTVLGMFLLSICLALILGGGRFGILPVISITGTRICLGISVILAAVLLVMCFVVPHWSVAEPSMLAFRSQKRCALLIFIINKRIVSFSSHTTQADPNLLENVYYRQIRFINLLISAFLPSAID